MPIENLAAGVESLKSEYERTNAKRQYWATKTVPLLKKTLENVVSQFDLSWTCQVLNDSVNAGEVNLSFGKNDSGIFGKTGESIMKTGGTLAFSQEYNGDILVTISYPAIETLLENREDQQLLHRIHPEKIDEEMIYLQVGKFLTEMIAWESATGKKEGVN